MRYTSVNVTFKRCLHMTSPCNAAKAQKTVPLSKFELDTNLPYEKLNTKLKVVRDRLNRPLTLSEKVLYSHIAEPETQVIMIQDNFVVWHK